MKTFGNILKVIGAVAAIAAIVFVIVRYGNQIVAWFKKILAKLGCRCCQDAVIYDTDEVPAEDAVTADDKDFEN